MMKVALINFWTLRMRRGVETLVPSLANELAKRGVDVSILTARQTVEPLVKSSPVVHLKQFPTFGYFEFSTIAPFYAVDLIQAHYDFVVIFFTDFGEDAALKFASLFTKSKIFLYLTFPPEAAPHRYTSYERRGWGKRATRIIADAEYTAQCGAEFFHRPVQTLPSGTDPGRFTRDEKKRAAARSQFGFKESDVVLLNVAALQERKGVARMIEALPDLIAGCPDVRYLIFGEGSQKEMLEQRVNELHITERVTFAGTTNDLTFAYNAADIFVMLSNGEAGSIACLEAMASELPVVVSNEGGFGEVVNARNGRSVDYRDQQAIVRVCAELASNCTLRQQLGQAGRQVIIDKFSWARIAEQLHHMFEEESQMSLRAERSNPQT